MNSIKNIVLFLFIGAIAAGCNKGIYKKTPGGMPYQVFRGKGNEQIKPGSFVKIHLSQKIKDSVYYTTEGKLPIFLQVNETPQPYDIAEIWTSLRVGDSAITTQMMDTFIKRAPQNIAPGFKKGDRIVTYIKVLGVYANDSLARVDDQNAKKEWLEKEIRFVEKYLADKNIKAQKTPEGAFVEIFNPGTGNLIDSGNYISVNYTGTTFAGVKFDSSTDTAFHHVEPYSFQALSGMMIKGFDDALRFLRPGAKARIYVPSILGYGGNPNSPLIKPYENLIFDIEIVKVDLKSPADRPGPQVTIPGK